MAGKRYAFVLGSKGPRELAAIGRADIGPLQYAEMDAERVTKVLQSPRCGFEVIRCEPDLFEIERRLREAAARCDESDTFLCYFSGHGEVAKGGGLFLLLDRTELGRKLPYTALSAASVMDLMRLCDARRKLLILDCCHAGAAGGTKSAQGVKIRNSLQDDDTFLVLAASGRLEKARELTDIQGSFLTDRLCRALSDLELPVVDRDTLGVTVENLKTWLEKEAAEHNRKNPLLQVPKPYFFGQWRGDLSLTLTAGDWEHYEIDWPDGSTMVVLPAQPVEHAMRAMAAGGSEVRPVLVEADSARSQYAFCIGKHLITNAQYRKVMEVEPVGEVPGGGAWPGEFYPMRDPGFNNPDQPVVCVTLDDCRAYAARVNELGSGSGKFSGLPTGDIWDYAAFRRTYPTTDRGIWKDADLRGRARPGGAAPLEIDRLGESANDQGITDLIGNIWQWCLCDREGNSAALRGGPDSGAGAVPYQTEFSVREERVARSDLGFRLAGLVRLDQLDESARVLLRANRRKLDEKDVLKAVLSGAEPGAPVRQAPPRRVVIPEDMRLRTPVRVLVAASEGLENELAVVRETLYRSPICGVPINLCEWNAYVREWMERSDDGSKYPPISPYDGVVLLIAGRPAGALSIPDLYKAATNYVTGRERWLSYQIWPTGGKIPESEREGKASKRCDAGSFAEQFWNDHLEFIPNLVHPRQAGDLEPIQLTNPYPGLKSYGRSSARFFHGRSAEVSNLCKKFVERSHGLVTVVGPSGSGKSSLVRAGLFYRLSLDAIPGSAQWTIADVERTRSPLAATADALRRECPALAAKYPDSSQLERSLRTADEFEQIVALALAGKPANARLLLFYDQFEEVFTLVPPQARARFLAQARELALHPRVHVLLTIRADFYTDLMATELGKMDEAQHPFWLRPADERALFQVIYWPAVMSGWRFDDADLPRRIREDAGSGAGVLPLLSYAMNQFVDAALEPRSRAGAERGTPLLTAEAYNRLGGVRGVVERAANAVWEKHRPAKDTISGLFRHLVHVADDGTATKKPAHYEPGDKSWTKEELELADSLVEARLLNTDKPDPKASSYTFEIAHEALLNHWPVLKEWVEDSKAALRTMQTAESAAKEWKQALDKLRETIPASARPDETRLLELDLSVQQWWPQERLKDVREAMRQLGLSEENLRPETREFIRDETQRLLEELELPVGHARRDAIGKRLAALGDPRRGLGLRDGIPEIEWCRVPAGIAALFGDDGRELGRKETPGLYIARYEVTICQFEPFLNPKVYFDEQWWTGLAVSPSQHKPYGQQTASNCPAQFVSWYQAIAYCRWLSRQLGYEVRLPTEWEWTLAATGGNPDFLYPWSRELNDWDDARASHSGGVRHVIAVGLYPRAMSPVGAMGMVGNVPEWCQNEFERPEETGIAGTNNRTTRGGSFFSPPAECTVRFRLSDRADGTKQDGHRIATCMRLAADHPPADALFYEPAE